MCGFGKDLPFKSCLAMAGVRPHAAVARLRTVQSGKYLAREPMPDANFFLLHRAIGIAVGSYGLGPRRVGRVIIAMLLT